MGLDWSCAGLSRWIGVSRAVYNVRRAWVANVHFPYRLQVTGRRTRKREGHMRKSGAIKIKKTGGRKLKKARERT